MGQSHICLRETHIIGPKTNEQIIGANECPALKRQQIILCGLSDTAAPYCMVRRRLDFSECVVTLSGEGQVLQNETWKTVRAGDAYIAGQNSFQAFKAITGRRWRIAWVHFDKPIYDSPPRITRCEGSDLAAAIGSLHREVVGLRDQGIEQNLASLIDSYGRRIASPTPEPRLRKLWLAVNSDLAAPWTLESLAARASVSTEHLRRLSLSEQGVPPMRHVAELRLRRGAALLRSSSMKLEVIAAEIGYATLYSFSAAFKKWSGHPPGAWRSGSLHPEPSASPFPNPGDTENATFES